jgi:hypothetical protein
MVINKRFFIAAVYRAVSIVSRLPSLVDAIVHVLVVLHRSATAKNSLWNQDPSSKNWRKIGPKGPGLP